MKGLAEPVLYAVTDIVAAVMWFSQEFKALDETRHFE